MAKMSIKTKFDLREPRAVAVPDFPWNGHQVKSNTLVGIEVEVENVGRHRATMDAVWEAKQDGSLRNSGVEFITKPIEASSAPRALNFLMTRTLADDICFSPRTSVHIHLDCTQNTTEQVSNVILLYSIFEKMLFKFVGRQRSKSVFCVPLTESSLIYEFKRRGVDTRSWSKYSGLNIRPLSEYGTIEFRHMHGTADVQKLSVWIDLITRLKDYGCSLSGKAVTKIISELNDDSDFRSLIQDVFGDTGQYLKYEGLTDVIDTYKLAKVAITPNHCENLRAQFSAQSPYLTTKGNS